MGKLGAEEYSDASLAHMITALFMEGTEVSDRTDTTYRIGARIMLEKLMAGDLRPSYHNPEQDEFMTEFLGRVLQNVERQNFELPEPLHS